MTESQDAATLLRKFEPVMRFTAGELFFPTSAASYVANASLWADVGKRGERCIVARGELTEDRLVHEAARQPGTDLSLRFVEQPLGRSELRTWRRRPDRPTFQSRGRFTQVGLISRLLDGFFRLAVLLRGKVPGGLAARAELDYRARLDPDHHPYYGRIVRDGGYVIVQYWFFYAMNDWRSSFGGANDHEADWEQVTVYVTQDGTELRPRWVAISAHDEVGADLRRRWDDPELTREGDHPVVYAGAGSHSGAFVPGEYVTAVDPPGMLHYVLRACRAVARVVTPWSRGEIARGIGFPFVDYSRGDGDAIGPGHERCWSLCIIDDDTPWVRRYRGLWGLDTRDRFGGERAPAGPRYERGGIVRQSWADPLGWAGLHAVTTSREEAREYLRQRIAALDAEIESLDADIVRRRTDLRTAAIASTSIRDHPGLAARAAHLRGMANGEERDIAALIATRAAVGAERDAHVDTLRSPPPIAPPQAHLRHKAVPVGQAHDGRARLLRVWSTLSAPLLVLAAAFLVLDQRLSVLAGVSAFVVLFLTIEAIARGYFAAFAVSLTLAVVGALVAVAIVQGVLGQWRIVVAALLGGIAAAILVSNLRDLRRG